MASASPPLVGQGGASRRADAGVDLRVHGLMNTGTVFANLSAAALTEAALARGEGLLSRKGAFAAYTGTHTGRSPKDRYLVAQPPSQPGETPRENDSSISSTIWGVNRAGRPASAASIACR